MDAAASPPPLGGSFRSEWTEVMMDMTAGTLGGCSGIVVGQPLDTIKVRLQSNPTVFRNSFDCFMKTVRQEGVLALFKGLTSPLVGNAPLNAIVFGAFGQCQRFLNQNFPEDEETRREDPHRPNFLKLGISGFWAGTVQLVVTTPVELVKCKLQVQRNAAPQPGQTTYKGSWDCIREIVRHNGIRGLYRGNVITFWRDAPAYGAYFAVYEGVKWSVCKWMNQSQFKTGRVYDPSDAPLWLQLWGGGVAGVVTWMMTYAADPLKSVIQTMPDSAKYQETRMSVVAREMYRKDGMRFFYRGIGPTLLRSFPANAVTLMVYDKSLSFMRLHAPTMDEEWL